MKNIVKTVWYCWNKTDRFVAVFSIIAIIFMMCFMCTSCNAQPSINNIPTMEYYDASGEKFDIESSYEDEISFVPANIIDFVYRTQDNEYVIEYSDSDVFDIDNMVYDQDDDYYYIEIYCDSTLFFECLSYYNSLGGYKNPKFSETSSEYFIKEEYLSDGSTYYKLVKHAAKKDN